METEHQKKEKTEEDQIRLRAERKLRRQQKKLLSQAAKRGITPEALAQEKKEKEKQEQEKEQFSKNRKKRPREEPKTECIVYVGNIVYRAGEAEVRRLFASIGEKAIVSIDLPKDKETGKFYGVAFVEFDCPENAQKALQKNNFKLLGRPVTVELKSARGTKKAKHQEVSDETNQSKSGSNAADGADATSSTAPVHVNTAAPVNDGSTLFVAKLADSATDEEIMTFFSKSGRVLSLRRIHDKVTKAFTGAAFVQFGDPAAAKRAMAFHGTIFHHRPLQVELAKQKTMK